MRWCSFLRHLWHVDTLSGESCFLSPLSLLMRHDPKVLLIVLHSLPDIRTLPLPPPLVSQFRCPSSLLFSFQTYIDTSRCQLAARPFLILDVLFTFFVSIMTFFGWSSPSARLCFSSPCVLLYRGQSLSRRHFAFRTIIIFYFFFIIPLLLPWLLRVTYLVFLPLVCRFPETFRCSLRFYPPLPFHRPDSFLSPREMSRLTLPSPALDPLVSPLDPCLTLTVQTADSLASFPDWLRSWCTGREKCFLFCDSFSLPFYWWSWSSQY